MRTLNNQETFCVSGSVGPGMALAVTGGAAAGSMILGSTASVLGPVSTVITTTVGIVGCGVVGTMVMPVVGTVVGASTCGLGSYYLGSSLVTASSYLTGALAGGAGAYIAMVL